ncbi:MAG: helix-turn-helix transcriptional regulator [Clostridia bacterium]|nr:helix-turn-helix transcriptional regulator [Clostridia bacterium]
MLKYDDSYKIQQGSYFAVAEKQISNSQPQQHTFLHYHKDMELLFIEEGSSVMQVAGKMVKADKGSLIIVNPYEVHSGETTGGKYAHRCICFDLEQLGLPETAELLLGKVGYSNVIEDTEMVQPYFSACFEAVKNRFDGWEMRAKGNLLMMFSSLTDRITSSKSTKEQKFSKEVLDYIEEHFSEDISSKELAEMFSYDHSYFCRKFKLLFSQKFSDFLNGYRVSKAKELLKTKSVSSAAVDCGFQNISYFSRVFKAVTGMTPSEFKKVNL